MYTLQILDAGQTFLHAVGDRPITLGSGGADDVRLREQGVQPAHARIEPSPDGAVLFADAEVRINGDLVQRATLQLGDRIEIGRAVLVVGRTVARAARPEDVLAAAPTRTARRPRKSGGAKWLPIAGGLAVLAVVVGYALQSDGQGQVRSELAYVERLRAGGDLDAARAEIARLRRAWSDASDDRLARLADAAAAVDQVDAAREALLARALDPADTRSYAEWMRELQQLEQAGAADERVAARQVRSQLRATLRERDERARAQLATTGADPAAPQAVDPDPVPTAAGPSQVTADAAGPAIETAEIDALCGQGLFAQALALVQAGFDQARDAAAVAGWQATERSVRARANEALAALLADARRAADDGRLEHAITLLQSGRHRFPAGAGGDELGQELTRLQTLAAAPAQPPAPTASGPVAPPPIDEATRLATLASLRSQMDAIRAAEERSAFAEASRLLREAADAVRSRDVEFAGRLATRSEECALLAAWHEAVAAAVAAGRQLASRDADGRELRIVGADGDRLLARTADGEGPLAWHEVAGDGVVGLVEQLRVRGEAALGAAALLYKQGETAAAERVLAEVVRADAGAQSAVDRVIARGRGEPVGEHGYALQKGGFVSLRDVELDKRKKQLGPKVAAALRAKDPGAREAVVAEAMAEGPLEVAALAGAMRDQLVDLRDKLESGGLKKQFEKLAAARAELDAARQHAKELIFDEVRYFYPYKPPAVSGERHAEYNRVQQEVDRRVAAVRNLWQDGKLKVRVPQRLGEDLQQLEWIAGQVQRLGGFSGGESSATALEGLAWARALTPGALVGLQEFCLDPAERAERELWQRVERFNVAIGPKLSSAQRELLRITNDYRVMFGHRPLAAVPTCCAASQGHADEMSRLGYFSHTSPTPGLKTPVDRTRKAGYMFGVSENIAMTGGAQSSHDAWCHSSGHHRNLLSAGHREIGIGANGRYWVQNFGSGDVHKSLPEWPADEPR